MPFSWYVYTEILRFVYGPWQEAVLFWKLSIALIQLHSVTVPISTNGLETYRFLSPHILFLTLKDKQRHAREEEEREDESLDWEAEGLMENMIWMFQMDNVLFVFLSDQTASMICQ